MSVNEEFLDKVFKNFLKQEEHQAMLTSIGRIPTTTRRELAKEAKKAILQHFQQEQERAKLEAKLEELGEIQGQALW